MEYTNQRNSFIHTFMTAACFVQVLYANFLIDNVCAMCKT